MCGQSSREGLRNKENSGKSHGEIVERRSALRFGHEARCERPWIRRSSHVGSVRRIARCAGMSTTKRTMNPEIKTIPMIRVAALEHRGPQHTIFSTVSKFIEWRRASSCSPVREARTFGIAYDDPENTDPNMFRFDVCGELRRPLEPNDFGVVEKIIPEGRYAVVRHQGSTDAITPVVREMYQKWLPESGEELRDFPVFFEYVRRMPEVLEHEQITDIYLAIV